AIVTLPCTATAARKGPSTRCSNRSSVSFSFSIAVTPSQNEAPDVGRRGRFRRVAYIVCAQSSPPVYHTIPTKQLNAPGRRRLRRSGPCGRLQPGAGREHRSPVRLLVGTRPFSAARHLPAARQTHLQAPHSIFVPRKIGRAHV